MLCLGSPGRPRQDFRDFYQRLWLGRSGSSVTGASGSCRLGRHFFPDTSKLNPDFLAASSPDAPRTPTFAVLADSTGKENRRAFKSSDALDGLVLFDGQRELMTQRY